ncbi:MAG TPA: hypothetical protein VEH04_04645 [Verrucomicrobiae bacterium]|nr:hypothetical protein [Verrucomicrobiae bacterium]
MASLHIAQRKARDLRRLNHPSINSGIRIFVESGTYRLTAPLLFRSEDSGTAQSPTVIEAAPGAAPTLSGGIAVRGWRKGTGLQQVPASAREHVWVAPAPRTGGRIVEFRQLWINDRKAVRARNPNGNELHRMIVWDRTNCFAQIPAASLLGIQDPLGPLEIIFHQQWEIAICRVSQIEHPGNAARLRFHQPESALQCEHPWPQPVMGTNGAPFFLANAIEFLDEPGEWFQEYPGGQICYWPRSGENLETAEIIAPVLETLVQAEGTRDHPASHIHFRGMRFAHTTWMRPSLQGHVPLQAGMYLLDAYKLSPKGTRDHSAGLDNQGWLGRPPGAVSVRNASHFHLERCRFEHLAMSGLDVHDGTHDGIIEGNVFRDIGGNGIQLGEFADPGFETHRPFNPTDEREIATRHRVANNVLTDTANEDWGCVGIAVGFGREISVEHNDISNTSYTGISMGWGWNKAPNVMRDNRIVANHIHKVATRMCDTAGIYTLSPQPGTLIASNHVHSITMSPYVSDPSHWFYLYLDEGSSHITVRDNWCPEERFLKNANGPGNVWDNNGPMVSENVKRNAGLQPQFRELLKE